MTLASFIARSHADKESWRYTNLDALLASSFPPRVVAQGEDDDLVGDRARLVFVNGILQTKQSRFGAVPSCILMGDATTGYKLTLGEHTCLVTQPIELIFLTDAAAPREISIKLSIEIGENGRLTLLENHPASFAITTVETDILLHSRAKFVHGKMVCGGAHLAQTTARISGGASYNNFALLKGCAPTRNEIDVQLNGEQAQAILNGVMLLQGSEHADTTLRVTHNAPHCASRQIYKTVLSDKSRGVFQGKIVVAKHAQKTDGYQLSRALLLSDQAEIDAKPELEIYADDVKCSHGSTVGDLDDNALFYLRARGLSEAEARALLIDAFIGESIDDIQVEEWRPRFHTLAQASSDRGTVS
jgi:Fe-S cluster assembly protein SufD